MFGFYVGERVLIKNNEKYKEGIVLRNFIPTTCYLVRVEDGRELAIDRNDLVKIKEEN